MSTGANKPIRVPPSLPWLATRLGLFYAKHPQYDRVVCSAYIFAPQPPPFAKNHVHFHEAAPPTRRLLLVRRCPTDDAVPSLWDIPGGTVDNEDPDVLNGFLRAIREETGLHIEEVSRLVGDPIEWTTTEHYVTEKTPREIRCVKFNFEVKVREIAALMPPTTEETDVIGGYLSSIPVKLDPKKHQAHAWARKEEIIGSCEGGEGDQTIPKDQLGKWLRAFEFGSMRRAEGVGGGGVVIEKNSTENPGGDLIEGSDKK
ncbi:MAG: hypothetical protein Q9168_005863 [Polycauliona sp. 1 TL-2023]